MVQNKRTGELELLLVDPDTRGGGALPSFMSVVAWPMAFSVLVCATVHGSAAWSWLTSVLLSVVHWTAKLLTGAADFALCSAMLCCACDV